MLSSISPIDGRYEKQTQSLSAFFSEGGLMHYRLFIETEYLIALSELGLPHLRKLTDEEKIILKKTADIFPEDSEIISKIEKEGYKDIPATNHDVKAIEYFLKIKLADSSLKDVLEWIHFGLTSEDVNNLAYALMLKNGLSDIILPCLHEITDNLSALSEKHKDLAMLARTHGQSASPTTFGKELKVFVTRIQRQLGIIENTKILAKLNGATGNYNAHVAAYPNIDWPKFSQKFIEELNEESLFGLPNKFPEFSLSPNLYTTQIEPHDSYIEIFDALRRINSILIDFNQDIWRYVSDGWLKQNAVAGEVGSSTMPHKINPINFENSEGNLGLANSLFEFFARKLPISRLQRDLSDSTVQRNIGTALGHCLVAYKYLLKGLARIEPDKQTITADLQAHPEVIAEAIQTILRREGVAMPYEKLKELTRGEKVSLSDIYKFIDNLEVSPEIKKELKAFTPENYIGLANKLTSL